MAEKLKKGDKVAWNTTQGKTTGKVEEKVTGKKRVGNKGQKGTEVKGSNAGGVLIEFTHGEQINSTPSSEAHREPA